MSLYLYLLAALLAGVVLDRWWFEVLVCRIRGVIVLPGVWVIVRIVQYDVWRQALYDPFVLQALVRRQALLWVPLEAPTDEVDK